MKIELELKKMLDFIYACNPAEPQCTPDNMYNNKW